MSNVKIACPQCQQHIECDAAYGGTQILCPSCAAQMLVPLVAETNSARSSSPALDIDSSRPELQGFCNHYSREIEPYLKSRQQHQRTVRIKAFASGLGGSILTAVVGWWTSSKYELYDPYFYLPTSLLFIATGTAVWWFLDDFQKGVKGFLLLEVCRFFRFEYSEQVGDIEFHEFENSGLLPPHDRRNLEDRIHGNHDGVAFDLFECQLEIEKQSENNKSTYYQEVYHGVLFRFSFPKRFRGRTLVLKDRGLIGNFFKGSKVDGERIKLEDPRFEKLFEVWGDDQIEARYLLTPTFMERAVELARTIDSKRIELSFVDNQLLISVHVTKNQFEGGGLFTDVTDQRRVAQLVDEICRVFDIVDTLKLNLKTRI